MQKLAIMTIEILKNRRTLIIIGITILSLIITVILIFAFFSKNNESPSEDKTPQKTAQETSYDAELYFDPPIIDLANSKIVGQQIAALFMNVKGNYIKSVRLALKYNPTLIRNISVEPAADQPLFGPQTKVFIINEDQNKGYLEVVIGSDNVISGEGKIADIRFTPHPDTSNTTSITISDETTINEADGKVLAVGFVNLDVILAPSSPLLAPDAQERLNQQNQLLQ